MNRISVFLVLLPLALYFAASSALAQTDQTWNGGNGSWNVGGNWSSGTVPTGVIDNALIDGGNSASSTVQIDDGDRIAVGSLTIDSDDSLIFAENSYLEILTDSAVNPDSGRVHNAGQIQFNSSTGANLKFDHDLTLSGGGTVVLNQGADIRGSITGGRFGKLINQDNTIQGTGTIGFGDSVQLTNEDGGVIHANVSGKNLNLFPSPSSVIFPNEIDVVNRGTVRASNGGSLNITSSFKIRIDNTGGLIEAIDGGQISAPVADLEIFGGTMRVESGGELFSGNVESLTDLTIEGTGTVNVGRQNSNLITDGNLQINADGASIDGIDNRGELTIVARSMGLSNLTNHGSVRVESDAMGFAGQIDNRGVLDFTAGLSVAIGDEAEIIGGGTIRLIGLDRPGGGESIKILGGGNDSHLINAGGSTISGIGEIGSRRELQITNQAGSLIDANVAPQDGPVLASLRLVDNGTTIVNRGTLRASDGGVLVLDGKIDNMSGVIEAIDGGRVGNDSSGTEISGGTVQARTGGEFRFGSRGASISDATIDVTGTIQSEGDLSISDSIVDVTGPIHSGRDLSLRNVTNQGDLELDAEQTGLSGQIVNQGTMTFLDNESRVVASDLTLTGGGTLRLRGKSLDDLQGGNFLSGELINSTHKISGAGVIFGKITNQAGGLIDANVAGPADGSGSANVLALIRVSSDIVNQGTLRASNSGTLALIGEGRFRPLEIDNRGGIIESVEGSLVYSVDTIAALPGFGGGVDITGGTLRTRSGGRIALHGRLSNLQIDGTIQAVGDLAMDNVSIEGEIENNGEIIIGDFDGSSGDGRGITIAGPVTLSGGGTVDLRHGTIRGITAEQSVLNNIDNTIKGPGQIGDGNLTFVNGASGYVIAVDEAPLQIQADVTNHGVFQIDSGGRMVIDGPLTNSTVGSIVGNGTLQSTETIINEGRIAPGASVGELQIDASMTFTETAILEIEIDESGADLLTVLQGNINLDGDLQINLLANYMPSESDVFDILNVVDPGLGMLEGTFAGIGDGDRVTTQDGGGSFVVHYDHNVGRVWLGSFVAVPEPGSAVLLGILGVALVGRSRRRFGQLIM